MSNSSESFQLWVYIWSHIKLCNNASLWWWSWTDGWERKYSLIYFLINLEENKKLFSSGALFREVTESQTRAHELSDSYRSDIKLSEQRCLTDPLLALDTASGCNCKKETDTEVVLIYDSRLRFQQETENIWKTQLLRMVCLLVICLRFEVKKCTLCKNVASPVFCSFWRLNHVKTKSCEWRRLYGLVVKSVSAPLIQTSVKSHCWTVLFCFCIQHLLSYFLWCCFWMAASDIWPCRICFLCLSTSPSIRAKAWVPTWPRSDSRLSSSESSEITNKQIVDTE